MPKIVYHPYEPTLFERIIDNVVDFFGSLFGLPAVINRPLHFYEPHASHPRTVSPKPDASAWRRERHYLEQRHLLTMGESHNGGHIMPAPIPNRQKAARHELGSLFAHPAGVRVIHYSSESFDDRENGKSPRVTSIAVRRLDNGQTDSFSIHAIAEERGVDLAAVSNDYDSLEKEMLERFYAHTATDREAEYLHWNMRDSNYGFSALAHRLRVLHGVPSDIPGHKRHDLARLLQDIYGTDYIQHPRLEHLTRKNRITSTRFLTGKQEAEAFSRGDYVALHQSTLRKVDIIADIADRANSNTLLTNSSWWTMNGGSMRGALSWVATNAIILLLISLASLAVGALGTWIAIIGSVHAH